MVQKILVVEDNELNLKLFCDLLRAHGYAAEPVRDGREALDRARGFVPDLVVMDIQMPHISGLELIEQMKADAALRRIPIMAVTAYAAKGDEERIRDAGAEGYVSKPISVMKFVAAVASLLEASTGPVAPATEPRQALPDAGEAEPSEVDQTADPADEAASETAPAEEAPEARPEGSEAETREVDQSAGRADDADAVSAPAGEEPDAEGNESPADAEAPPEAGPNESDNSGPRLL